MRCNCSQTIDRSCHQQHLSLNIQYLGFGMNAIHFSNFSVINFITNSDYCVALLFRQFQCLDFKPSLLRFSNYTDKVLRYCINEVYSIKTIPVVNSDRI